MVGGMNWSKDALEAGQVKAVVITRLHSTEPAPDPAPDPLWQPRGRRGKGVGELQGGLSDRLGPLFTPVPSDFSMRRWPQTGQYRRSKYLFALAMTRARRPRARPQAPLGSRIHPLQLRCGFRASAARRGPWAAKPLGLQLNVSSCASGSSRL